MVVPCIEKTWLYASGERNPISGLISCVRMSIAKITAKRKNTSAVPMYIRPIFLWSVVVSHAPRPPRSAACAAPGGTTTSPSGAPPMPRSIACLRRLFT